MGFFKNVGNRVRGFFGRDKEQAQFQLARGTGYSTYPGQELLHAYGYDSLAEYLRLDTDLLGRFIDYEAMDEYPELASALDIYADDVCQPDSERKRSVWVESRDSNVLEVLDELFLKTLRLDEEVWTIARTVAKYGNDYEEILISDAGVIGLNFLPPATMRRAMHRIFFTSIFLLRRTIDCSCAAIRRRCRSATCATYILDLIKRRKITHPYILI
jgi:hypothetical protein